MSGFFYAIQGVSAMNASVRFNLLFYMLKSARKLLTTPVKKPAKKKDSGALDAVG